MPIEIVGFTDYSSSYPTIHLTSDIKDEVVSAVVNYFKDKTICYSGNYHQNGDYGVPVFSNGTCLRCSMRKWAQLMGMIYSSKDDYMSYYMNVEQDGLEYLPEEEAEVEPSKETSGLPIISDEDVNVMHESISFGMVDFFTTDLALKVWYPEIKRTVEMRKKSDLVGQVIKFTFNDKTYTFTIVGTYIKDNHTYACCIQNGEKKILMVEILEDGEKRILNPEKEPDLVQEIFEDIKRQLAK